jgi:hypothetical protein
MSGQVGIRIPIKEIITIPEVPSHPDVENKKRL